MLGDDRSNQDESDPDQEIGVNDRRDYNLDKETQAEQAKANQNLTKTKKKTNKDQERPRQDSGRPSQTSERPS